MNILILTERGELWKELEPTLTARGAVVRTSAALTDGDIQEAVRAQKTELVIIDRPLDIPALRAAVFSVLSVDAMIHTVAVSVMTDEAFHDAAEGLGMLMNLPSKPSPADIERMTELLAGLGVL